ncbi:MAG: hypothetical protein ACK6AD_13275 [Cyanobacteriota bacterium]
MLQLLQGAGGSLGNPAALEALSPAIDEVSQEACEATRERLAAMGLIRKGRGRGGSIALAEGRETAPAPPLRRAL